MIGNKTQKILGMMARARLRVRGRDACGRPGIELSGWRLVLAREMALRDAALERVRR